MSQVWKDNRLGGRPLRARAGSIAQKRRKPSPRQSPPTAIAAKASAARITVSASASDVSARQSAVATTAPTGKTTCTGSLGQHRQQEGATARRATAKKSIASAIPAESSAVPSATASTARISRLRQWRRRPPKTHLGSLMVFLSELRQIS